MHAERCRRENELNTQANIRTAEGEKFAINHQADVQKYQVDKSTEALIGRIQQIKLSVPNLTDQE